MPIDADQHHRSGVDVKKFILLVCTLGLLCACNGHNDKQEATPAESAAEVESTVTFGYLPTSEHNESYQRGLSIALDEANSKNFVLGGQPVRFVWQAANHNQMQSLTHTLNHTKWNAVLGQIGPKASTIVEKTGLPAISLLSDSDTTRNSSKTGVINNIKSNKTESTVFRVLPTVNQQGKMIAQYLHQQDIKKIVIVSQGRSSPLVSDLQAQLRANGQNVTIFILKRFNQTEWRQLVAQLSALKPELVFYSGDGSSAAQLVKRLQQNRLLIPLMTTAGVYESNFIIQAEQYAPGSMAMVPGLDLSEMKSTKSFIAAYQEKYQQQPDSAAAYGYDAAWVIITAMRLANSAKPHVYLPKLRSLNMSSGLLSGPLTFNRQGERNEVAMTVYQVEEDKWILADIINASPNQSDTASH